jgi:hypothetical protein
LEGVFVLEKSKKAFRRISATLLAVASLTVFSSTSLAAENNTGVDVNGDNVSKFYDEEIGAYITPFKNTDDGLVPISEGEYKSQATEEEVAAREPEPFVQSFSVPSKGQVSSKSVVTPSEIDYRWWKYKETSASKYYGSPIKVSATQTCTASTCSVAKKWEATISKAYSVTASTEIKAINTGASFTITSAKSDSSTYTFTIKKGQRGYVAFKPYKRKSVGTLTQYSNMYGKIKSKSANATSAIKLKSGEADGDYIFVYTKK